MKNLTLITTVLTTALLGGFAKAAPAIDVINVQGYMKRASGAAVTDGTYTMAFGVFQNGTAIWGTQGSVVVQRRSLRERFNFDGNQSGGVQHLYRI